MPPYRLIVTEKPSVARDIARVLKVRGKGRGCLRERDLVITWCLGHLVELAEPKAYDPEWRRWSFESLPMLPEAFRLEAREDTADQWGVVRDLLRSPDLQEVVNACDAGREGELIFGQVFQLAGCKAPVRRLWISSMTEQAIREGFGRLRDGAEMGPLLDAARSRSEADWLVGLNSTRAMTLAFRDGAGGVLLSVGRVQTPTLALLVEREEAIEGFVPEPFWQIKVRFAVPAGDWEAVWTDPKLRKVGKDADGEAVHADRLADKALAEAILERVRGKEGRVVRVVRKDKAEKPPLLYDLTALQREANKRFKWSAKHTLEVAQSLYERKKVITYPRTDSRHLGSDQVPGLPAVVRGLEFGPYETAAGLVLGSARIAKPGKRVVDDKEVSDHHAIIPTGTDPRTAGLDRDEKRLFDLVARRFLAAFHPDAVFATAEVDTKIGEDLFAARGRTLVDPGWRAIDPPASGQKDEAMLPVVEKGAAAEQVDIKLHEGTTKPPRRYTEATLLGAMERAGERLEDAELKRAMKRNGLGTPATRAAIIETLIGRGYVERVKNDLVPTAPGRALLAALPVDSLKSPGLTGRWESRLVAMAEGEEDRATFMADIHRFTEEVVRAVKDAVPDREVREALAAAAPAPDGELLGACPRCGGEVRAERFGWRCTGCPLRIPGKVAQREVSPRMAGALLKDGQTKAVKGFKSRAGKAFSAALRLDDEGKVVFDFPDPDALGDCPACGKPVRRRGKVWTCDTGRECSFVVFGEMSGRAVPDEAVAQLLASGHSEPVEGFMTRDARPFFGRLRWDGRRVVVEAMERRAAAGAVGACPRCGGEVAFRGGSWRCAGCAFAIQAQVARRPMAAEEVAELLREGRTPRLHGFRQQSGAVFKAALVLDPEQGVAFDYDKPEGEDEREAAEIAGGPPPAFGRRVDCPVCVTGAHPRPGYVIAGKAAWGCSRWKEGCTLRVPFEVEQRRIGEEDGRRLFGKKRATGWMMRTLHGAPQGPAGRVVLRPDEEPCWALELKG